MNPAQQWLQEQSTNSQPTSVSPSQLSTTTNSAQDWLDQQKSSPESSDASSASQNPAQAWIDQQNTEEQASSGILSKPTQINQDFNTYNPIEPTQGHRSLDTNFKANTGDSISVPTGKWYVVSTFDKANPVGSPGDYSDNQGWGNAVTILNIQTGDSLMFSHMGDVNIKPGTFIDGGTLVGTVSSSGNTEGGSNLGVSYLDKNGNYGDVMQTPYAKDFPVDSSKP